MVRLAALAVLAAVCFVAGRALHARAVVDPPAPPTTTTVVGLPPESEGDPCDDVALVETLLARTRESIEGEKMGFPDDPSVSPEEFYRLLDKSRTRCPDMTVDVVDCDEFPCIAWVRDSCKQARWGLLGAPSEIRNLTLGDGERAAWHVLFLVEGGIGGTIDPRKFVEGLRYETRTLRATDRILETTEARRMTEVEVWTTNVSQLERLVEAAPDVATGLLAEEKLADARARLDRAREHEESR